MLKYNCCLNTKTFYFLLELWSQPQKNQFLDRMIFFLSVSVISIHYSTLKEVFPGKLQLQLAPPRADIISSSLSSLNSLPPRVVLADSPLCLLWGTWTKLKGLLIV